MPDVNYCGKMCKNLCGLKLHQNQGGTCAEFSGIPPHKADPGKDAGGAKTRVVPQGPQQTSKWLQLQTHADHHNLVGPKPTRRQGGEADCLIHTRTAITARTERRVSWYSSGWFCLGVRVAPASMGSAAFQSHQSAA